MHLSIYCYTVHQYTLFYTDTFCYMHVRMYVRTYVRTHVCTYACMHICVCMYVSICVIQYKCECNEMLCYATLLYAMLCCVCSLLDVVS